MHRNVAKDEYIETRAFLEWVADRLVYIHGDSSQCYFVERLRSLAPVWDALVQRNKELNDLVDSYQRSNAALGTVLSELADICKRQAG